MVGNRDTVESYQWLETGIVFSHSSGWKQGYCGVIAVVGNRDSV